MNIIWDDENNTKLKKERALSFDEISAHILDKKYLDIVRHPTRPGQMIFIVPIHDYIHAVPFIIDAQNNIVLKTAFPSRKFHTLYRTKPNENKTR
jgi:uncharacterized DUF497 family protein